MSFQDLPQAIDPSAAQAPIQPDETAFADETLEDTQALGIVLQDANEAITFLQSKGLMPAGIENADNLVSSYVKQRTWSDGRPRANMPMHTVLEAIEKILPTLYMALFGSGKKRPFSLRAIGRTTPDAARAKEIVLDWAMKQAGTKEEMRRMLKTVLTYGFVVGWWGWETKTRTTKTYERGQDGKITPKKATEDINQPTFECLDPKNLLFDPSCKRQDIQKGARWVIKQTFIVADDLDALADDPTYKNIPTRDQLRDALALKTEPTEDSLSGSKRSVWREFQAELESKNTSADPLQTPLEILERWDGNRVITILQRKIVIRNEENEFGRLPGVSCAFVDVLGSAWGFGIARLLSGEQRLQQGVVNNWVDSLALTLNPVYQLLKGIGPGTQNIPLAPGKVITEAGELKPLVTPDVTGPAMTAITTSEERAARRVGANTGSNMPDQALRTGTGVQAFTGDVIQRLQYFLEIFINLVYVPVLEAFLEMSCDHLTEEQIQAILTEEQGKAFEGDILDVYKANCSVEVLAGTNLMAKYASAALLPQLLQLLSAAPVQDSLQIQNTKFDFKEALEQATELQGWDTKDFFKPMTDEDQQRAQQMNAARAKGMADMALENQKHQNDLESINEKGTVQAGVALVKQQAKAHTDEAMSTLENLNGEK